MCRRALLGALAALAALAAVLALLAPAAAAQGSDDTAEGFTDVTEGVHKPAIDVLGERGLFDNTLCGQQQFCPGDGVERWMMAVWLVRAVDGEDPPPTTESRFADVDTDAWWLPHVERLAELEITAGCKTDPLRYCPDRAVNRAQMASFLVRAFDLQPGPPAGFADVTSGSTHEANIDALAAAGVTVGCRTGPLRYCPGTTVTRAPMATFLARGLGLLDQPSDTEELSEDTEEISDVLGDPGDGDARMLIEGDWVIPVFVCAPVGKYTAVDVRDLTAVLNDELGGLFGRLSSQRMTLRFTDGSVLSDDIAWDSTIGQLRLTLGRFACGDEAISRAKTRQILIFVDVIPGDGASGYARLRHGPAVSATPAKTGNVVPLITVVHELAHSVLGLHHLKYVDTGSIFVNRATMSFSSDFAALPTLACYQYEQLGWTVPDYARPCARLTPSELESADYSQIGDDRGAVTWEPPEFSDDAPVTGYTVRLYRDTVNDDFSRTVADEPYAEYRLPADARSHLVALSTGKWLYRVEVAALSRYGEGDPSSVAYGPVPPPFGPIRITRITHEQIQLAWNTQRHNEYHWGIVYEIRYTADGTTAYEKTWPSERSSDTTIWLDDLEQGEEYTISIRACLEYFGAAFGLALAESSGCTGWRSITASTFTESDLPPPGPISVSSGSDWYLLTWDPVPGAEGYLIEVPPYGGLRTYTPDYSIAYGLEPDTTYSVKVGSCGPNPFSCDAGELTEVTVSTKSDAAVPPPHRIALREIGDSWATVQWYVLGYRRWLYRVEYEYTDGTTSSGPINHGQSAAPLRLTVEPNRTYTLKMRNCELPENGTECSTWTSFEFSTHPAASSVAPPSIRATDIADIWLQFSLERVPGAILYDWRYKEAVDNSQWVWSHDTGPTMETHWGLESDTMYTVEVRSCGEPIKPCSDWTTTTVSTVRSLPPAPPSYPVSVTDVTDTEIHLAWNASVPHGDYYDVRLFATEKQRRTTQYQDVFLSEDRVFSQLEPNTAYTIAVRTCHWSPETECDNWVAMNVTTRPSG